MMFSARRPLALAAALWIAAALVWLLAPASWAQSAGDERVWVQIEAHPSLEVATERAGAYAAAFPETQGYRLAGGWYAIALGPYAVTEGAARLTSLRRENLIPADSYITDGAEFRAPFWPAGAEVTPEVTPEVAPEAAPEAAPEPAAEAPAEGEAPAAEETPVAEAPPVVEEPEETLREARASEAALSPEDKRLLQVALKWFGHYQGAIDGAYGPGTRNAMAAWQESLGLEPTGTLTTRQRATLVANYEAEVAEYGFVEVNEQESGIKATLPMALIEFDHYEPPFVHFREKDGSGLKIVLISQPGDSGSLRGLFDILQTLDAFPVTGEREIGDNTFRIRGTDATRDSHAWARLDKGFIKGWMVLSTPANAARDARILEVIEAGFQAVGATALDPGLVPLDDAARRGLVAGLEVRRPRHSRSGFFVTPEGAVVTTVEAVDSCGRVTLDRANEASVALSDAATGLALVVPARPLAPPATARFQTAPDRIGAEVAVAGYSYEDRLPAPVLTFGTLEDSAGLDGEPGVKRLGLVALAGDAGGPVVDASGAVLGMLLPAPRGSSRQLPEGVAFAAAGEAIAQVLAGAGVTVARAEPGGALAPEDLTREAVGMTVLVSCWD